MIQTFITAVIRRLHRTEHHLVIGLKDSGIAGEMALRMYGVSPVPADAMAFAAGPHEVMEPRE